MKLVAEFFPIVAKIKTKTLPPPPSVYQPPEGQKDQRPVDAAGPSFPGPSGLPRQICIQVWNYHDSLFIILSTPSFNVPQSSSVDFIFIFPLYRHVIWASSSAGKSTFPGLADAFASAESSGQPSAWKKVHYHLSVLSQAIDSAANTLDEVI